MTTVTTPLPTRAASSAEGLAASAGRMIEIAVRLRGNRLAFAERNSTGSERVVHDAIRRAWTRTAPALADATLTAGSSLPTTVTSCHFVVSGERRDRAIIVAFPRTVRCAPARSARSRA